MNASPPPQPRQSSRWTTGLALLSLVLSGLLWITGLVDSLQRPSVGNSLQLRQLELTALAAPGLPAGLRQALTGAQPLEALRLDLQKQLDGNPVPPAPRQELQLALLELEAGQGSAARERLQELNKQVPPEQRLLLKALLEPASTAATSAPEQAALEQLLRGWGLSPLSSQLVCQALSDPQAACGDRTAQQVAVLRLFGTAVLPVLLLLLGSALLLRELWLRWRGKAAPPAPLVGPPLTL
ncbi:MAG: CPBP family intramembrane metalloprotease, partial [Cyanobium sp. MAG_237]|nr:CPBP family intramembrane metalloprotease [Cyanobium sp. MAG_237]